MNFLTKKRNDKPIAIYKQDDKSSLIYRTEEEEDIVVENMYDYVSPKDLKEITKDLNTAEIIAVERAIQTEKRPSHPDLATAYDEIVKKVGNQPNREIKTIYGSWLPYPQRNDILYLIGATGSGKSTTINHYLKEYMKIYPEVKNFWLFTDNSDPDPALAGLPIKKIKLDMKIVEKPIEPKELQNSVVIFDDVDSISNKKILEAITTLKGSVCKQGVSKNGITCIITNHSATEGKSTKHAIDNAKYIIIYPLGGTTGVEYLLMKKLGLDKQQYNKIKSCKSRVVMIHKRAPWYVIHSNGVFFL